MELFHYHVAQDPGAAAGPAFTSNEAAARFHLGAVLGRDAGLVLRRDEDLPALGTRLLRFTQTRHGLPVFGASAVVELTAGRDLVGVTAQLGEVTGVGPVASLSRAEALERVAAATRAQIPAEAGAGAELVYYQAQETGSWYLAWFFKAVPAAPVAAPEAQPPARSGHGLGPRPVRHSVDYLVDAHDGEILFCFSAVATAGPLRCTGLDENDGEQTFHCRPDAGGTGYLMDDPLRGVLTYDMGFADVFDDPPVPDRPVTSATSDYGSTNRAAVSAHLNASGCRTSTGKCCTGTGSTAGAWSWCPWSTPPRAASARAGS